MNKYLDIFSDLKEKILTNIYPPATFLPSENQLAKSYDVSRETIRKALVLLLENGYIQKIQGKGSIVIERPRVAFPITGLTSYKEIDEQQQMHSKTIVHSLQKKITADSSDLPFEGKEAYWDLTRQRSIDEEIVILDKDYLLERFVPSLTKEIAADSIYNYIENQLGLAISYAQKEITVEDATAEDRELMTLRENDTHVVVVRSKVFLEDATLFQFTESRHRIDKFKFVEFARRRH